MKEVTSLLDPARAGSARADRARAGSGRADRSGGERGVGDGRGGERHTLGERAEGERAAAREWAACKSKSMARYLVLGRRQFFLL
jgi:hypothetical protein